MDIPKEVFGRKRVVIDRLADAGFVLSTGGGEEADFVSTGGADESASMSTGGGCYVYTEKFMDGDLTAVIRISPDGHVSNSVIDTDTGDRYLPMDIEAHTGSYVGKARDEYRALLERIAEKCCIDEITNRRSRRRFWLIPSRPAQFDVGDAFKRSGNDTIAWHHRIDVMPGDIVYIYQTEPIASIMWECEVLDSYLPIPEDLRIFSPGSRYRMLLKRLRSFQKGEYPRSWLNEHGVKKTVRGQRSAPPELVEAMRSMD